jgi:hypothetical protein
LQNDEKESTHYSGEFVPFCRFEHCDHPAWSIWCSSMVYRRLGKSPKNSFDIAATCEFPNVNSVNEPEDYGSRTAAILALFDDVWWWFPYQRSVSKDPEHSGEEEKL